MAAKDLLGRRGEDAAVRYLEAKGLVVLARNWRCRHGELDVIATDRARLVVCEVKTRSGTGYGFPADAVTAAKSTTIRRVAARWLSAHHVRWCDVRYDLIAVTCAPGRAPVVEHYEGVI